MREETRTLEASEPYRGRFSVHLDIQSLLQTVTDSATRVCGAHFGAFFYNTHDENGDAYQLYTLSGAPEPHSKSLATRAQRRSLHLPLRVKALFDWMTCVQIQDTGNGRPSRHATRTPAGTKLPGCPVRSRTGEVLGGLFFGHPEPGVFTFRAERLVAGIALKRHPPSTTQGSTTPRRS